MQTQGTTSSSVATKQPWSVITVSVIAFLLPPGGALLTVRNLARLRESDRRRAGELTAVVFALYAAGFTVLLLLVAPHGGDPAPLAPEVSLVLSIGTALASYLALQRPYQEWRTAHRTAKPASVLSALITAVLYTFAISLAVTLIRFAIGGLAYLFGWGFGQI